MLFASWLAALGACGAMAWSVHVTGDRRKWGGAGSRARLKIDSPKFARPRLRGSRRGFEIVVLGPKPLVKISGVVSDFSLGRDSAMARAIKPDIETGDAEFDEIIRIEGDRDFALGMLDAKTRRQVTKFVGREGVWVEDGEIRTKLDDVRKVPEVLPRLLNFAELLRRPSIAALPVRLAASALEDESPGFCLQAFRHLVSEFHGTDEVRPTARALLETPHTELRLEAARALLNRKDFGDGDDELRSAAEESLAELALQREAEGWIRRLALEQLAHSKETDAAVRIARRLLLRPDELSMRRAALVALVYAGASDELLDIEPRKELKELETFAWGLGRSGDLRAQPRLLKLLEYPRVLVSIAAAKALGAVGDVRAVPALRRAAETRGRVRTALVGVAETAVEQIQARLGGSQGGEVSLVDPAPLEGAVSPADDDGESSEESRGGEVSLA